MKKLFCLLALCSLALPTHGAAFLASKTNIADIARDMADRAVKTNASIGTNIQARVATALETNKAAITNTAYEVAQATISTNARAYTNITALAQATAPAEGEFLRFLQAGSEKKLDWITVLTALRSIFSTNGEVPAVGKTGVQATVSFLIGVNSSAQMTGNGVITTNGNLRLAPFYSYRGGVVTGIMLRTSGSVQATNWAQYAVYDNLSDLCDFPSNRVALSGFFTNGAASSNMFMAIGPFTLQPNRVYWSGLWQAGPQTYASYSPSPPLLGFGTGGANETAPTGVDFVGGYTNLTGVSNFPLSLIGSNFALGGPNASTFVGAQYFLQP